MLLTPTSDNGFVMNVLVPPLPADDGSWLEEHEIHDARGAVWSLKFAHVDGAPQLAFRLAMTSPLSFSHEDMVALPALGGVVTVQCRIDDENDQFGTTVSTLYFQLERSADSFIHDVPIVDAPDPEGGVPMEVNDEGDTVPKELTRAVLRRSARDAEDALAELDEVLEL